MKARVFSGARPTGRQHIGNYLGAIQNYVALQEEYDCIYSVVDIHALTTLEETGQLKENIQEMVLDWLAAGIDPARSIVFVQSHAPQVMELHTFFSMVTPLSWLMRVPTFKDKVKLQPHNVNYGLLGYPVLMAADILLYKAEVVPVGEDQLPHLELTREIARRFNHLFGATFLDPQAKLAATPTILGLDGVQKMSKSLDNHIELAATPEETRARVVKAFTDPERIYRWQPGHPEVCNVCQLHELFDLAEGRAAAESCRQATIGCVEHKEMLAEAINRTLAPFRRRRAELAARPGLVEEVLADGAAQAQAIARVTLVEVKERMGLI